MLSRLFKSVGFKWAVRTAGFLTLAAVVVVNIIMRPRLPPRKRGSMIEPRHFKDPVFTFFVTAMFFITMGKSSLALSPPDTRLTPVVQDCIPQSST